MTLILITVDFETYYSKKDKYSLASRGMTYEKYIRDPRFEIIGLSYKVNDSKTEFLAPHEIDDWIKHIEIAYGWDNVRCNAQNGMFDFAILGWIYNVYPAQLVDTMLMSRAIMQWDGNSLDVITEKLYELYGWGCWDTAMGIKVGYEEYLGYECGSYSRLSKGVEVHNADGKRIADFTNEEYDAYAEYCNTDVDLTYSAYCWFMREYGFPEKEIDVMTMTLEMYTKPVMELDRKVLLQVQQDVESKRASAREKVGLSVDDLRSDAKFAEALKALGVQPPMKENSKGEQKFAFAKSDLAFINLLDHDDENVVALVQARLDNKSSQAVTRVQSFIDISSRGKLAVPIEYYAARTGRFGGSQAINAQNLNRNKLVGKNTKAGQFVFLDGKADRVVRVLDDNSVFLARAGLVADTKENPLEERLHEFGLRDSFIAPKGKVLVVNDLSQIEARMLAFIAGEQWVLDAFTSGRDIYKATASKSLGVPYDEVTKAQRFTGKAQVLGLGYQAGVNGLKVVLGKKSEDFDDSTLQSWVTSYRGSVPNIVALWNNVAKVLDAMVSGVSMQVDLQGILQLDGNTIIMPNGMRLVYRNINIKQGDRGFKEFWYWGKNATTGKAGWERTFSGRVVENFIQGLARIVLTDQMLQIRQKFVERGWSRDDAHLAMQVHDEVICCCREDIAEDVFEIMQYCMSKAPTWASGLPLGSDGDIARRYGCAK